MTLRRKLAVAFGGLAAILFLLAGVSFYVTVRWQATTTEVEQHYQRSLLLQRVRAETFQALKEVDDALTGDSVDARSDFARAIAPSEQDFAEWAALADTEAERAEVATVRAAYVELVQAARQVFALLEAGRRAEAVSLVDDALDTGDYARFQALTESGVRGDRARRQDVRAQTEMLRRTTQIMLAMAVLSGLSLTLLLSAFLAQDLFRPLTELRGALDGLARGDLGRRLQAERGDEFGEVNRAFNAVVEATEKRSRMAAASIEDAEADGDWTAAPSRVTLHRLATQLQGRLTAARTEAGREAALGEAEEIARALRRFAALGFPLDLELEEVNLGLLAHEALGRFREELARRGVSSELVLDPALAPLSADRRRLREAVSEALRNGLDALPEQGGRLGLRVTRDGDGGMAAIEIADDGRGMPGDLIDRALKGDPFAGGAHVGLALTRAVAEQHGGALKVVSEPGRGTVVRISVPAGA